MSSNGTEWRYQGGRTGPLHRADAGCAALLQPQETASIEGLWRDLAADAVEENPFFEPFTLLPALQHYAGPGVHLACVFEDVARTKLIGLAPVSPMRGYARLPIAYWQIWTHPHCYYAAPLLRRGSERAAAAGLLRLLSGGAQARAFLRLPRLDAAGAVAGAFRAEAVARVCYERGGYERAVLRAGETPEAYLAANIRKKKRKELKRLQARLDDMGRVKFRKLTNEYELEDWTAAFLDLEDKGWKSKAGTSLKSSAKDAAWFRESLKGAFDAGRLDFLRLDCGGHPVAMLTGFGSAESYSLKICHDPAFARFSPGVMIEIEATRAHLGCDAFRFADSCAAEDHSMINSLWRRRRRITGLNISGDAALSKALLRLCRLLEAMRSALPPAEEEKAR